MAKKKLKMQCGTIYQKEENGTFYFRYQINGERKAISLKTKNLKEAQVKAEEMIPVITAPSIEIIAAHVSSASFGKKQRTTLLSNTWDLYEQHPDKATPSTVAEANAYAITWNDFINFIEKDFLLNDITPEVALKYANALRKKEIAVSTHNRKIGHLRTIFKVLGELYDSENPFKNPSLKEKIEKSKITTLDELLLQKSK